MNAIKRRCARLTLAVMASVPVALACTAASRMGSALVEPVEGLPCFSLALAERPSGGAYRLYSMHVHRYEARAGEAIWSFELSFEGPGLDMVSTPCIAYGRTPPGAVRTRPAEPLVPGVRYLVTIGATSRGSSSSTQGYRAEFCVVAAPAGGVQIKQVLWDPVTRQWRREVCSPP